MEDEFVAPKPLNGDPDTGRLGGAPLSDASDARRRPQRATHKRTGTPETLDLLLEVGQRIPPAAD
jgi:hypothetical protein